MKNYVVSAVRPISEGWHLEKNQDLYKNYQIMAKISKASFEKFCQEPFEYILWEEDALNSDDCTFKNWRDIKQLWHSEPCNVFWAGADTLMVRPTNIFGRWQEFRLFNYTDPKSHGVFVHYFNDDVRYFPASMSAETWDLGESLWSQRETSPDRHWGFDQNRHNQIFWSQPIPDQDRHHPEMNWMAMNLRSLDANVVAWHEHWNNCPINRANILHFNASRGSEATIRIMRVICQQLGIVI